MHYWIPDVYQGAPTPTTAFLSVGSKAAGFIALIRFSTPLLHSSAASQVITLLALLACATLVVGNLAAIGQKNFKRLLAYSSISNAGFLLLALAANQSSQANSLSSTSIAGFYLATYLLMTVAAFFVLAAVHVSTGSEEISALNGLGQRNPALALGLTVVMASLAGVPLTAGFLGKFFTFQAAVASHIWWGVGLGFVGAAAGFYYYFKPIRAMWWAAPADPAPIVIPAITRSCVAILVAAILILGVWPQPILSLLGL
jgi:NADH-quinone oxidoreductase subunit N